MEITCHTMQQQPNFKHLKWVVYLVCAFGITNQFGAVRMIAKGYE